MTTIADTESPKAGHLAGTWHVYAPKSHAHFAARTMAGLVSVPGRFGALVGTLTRDEQGTSGALAIDAASIDTGNRLRDGHLRSRAFFDTAKHPELRYEVDLLDVDGTSLNIDGELVVAGTRIRLPLTAELRGHGDDEVEITCRTQLDRLQLGIRGARGMVPRTVDVDLALLLRRTQ
jgi:polyisoprenoid-binding protein YceI